MAVEVKKLQDDVLALDDRVTGTEADIKGLRVKAEEQDEEIMTVILGLVDINERVDEVEDNLEEMDDQVEILDTKVIRMFYEDVCAFIYLYTFSRNVLKIKSFLGNIHTFRSLLRWEMGESTLLSTLSSIFQWDILTLLTLSNFNRLFHSLFWMTLKWSVGVKGLILFLFQMLSNAPKWSKDVTKLMNPKAEHDWRLLASQLGYSNDDIRAWAQQSDPCMALLNEWYATNRTREANHGMFNALVEMNRLDAASIMENALKAVGNDDLCF